MPRALTGTALPALLVYGTAWKAENTQELVRKALRAGYRSFDTAAQPKHYREDLVGAAIRGAFLEKLIQRENLFLQTKYCPPSGQDPTTVPYDPSSPVITQVQTSIESSLMNLRPSESKQTVDKAYIDCLILHSPLETLSLTLEAWRALEQFVPHKIQMLGIANVNLAVLKALYKSATIKPSVVQNRLYPGTRFDVSLREFCEEKDILYEAFWTITANPALLSSDPVAVIVDSCFVGREIALYGLLLGIGNIAVLNGTITESRMVGDLEGLAKIECWKADTENAAVWDNALRNFKWLIGDSE